MEVGVASYSQRSVSRASPEPNSRGSPRSNLHVEFAQVGELKERKEKYLTAKYGAHQMSLIRKRLGVEMWIYDHLQLLYKSSNGEKDQEKEVDLDELLDIEDDYGRRIFLQEQLSDCKQSQGDVEVR
ncbi:Protein phosphatase 1 regulatory subunit 14B [Armadillidium vulgare]|nr:Protein phosphatase 1 regulatory subunit 14B [Armadillidium vulgare]